MNAHDVDESLAAVAELIAASAPLLRSNDIVLRAAFGSAGVPAIETDAAALRLLAAIATATGATP